MVASVLVAGFAGCKSDQAGESTGTSAKQTSVIVQQVEAAGSGDLNPSNEGAIQNWLARHTEVAKRVSPECGRVSKAATADWGATTEGRVCDAVAKAMFFTPKDLYNGYGFPAKSK
jgi:hypothetical protein